MKCMELDPFDPFVNLTMGRSEWLAGDLESGLPWMQRAVSLSPNYAFAIYNSASSARFLVMPKTMRKGSPRQSP